VTHHVLRGVGRFLLDGLIVSGLGAAGCPAAYRQESFWQESESPPERVLSELEQRRWSDLERRMR
jgi:hypothetical protein